MHSPEDDFTLGRAVLERRLVEREALLEVLFQMAQERRAGFARPLGVHLVSRGLLSEEDLNSILSPADARGLSEAELGKLLAASGLIRAEDVDACLKEQSELKAAGQAPPRLGALVIQRGLATSQQVMRVLAYQKRVLFTCNACAVRVSAVLPPPGTRYLCRKCGAALTPVETEPGAQRSMREAELTGDAQFDTDRAVAAYVRQKDFARRDQVRDAQHLQSEFARYGLAVPLLEILRRSGALTWEHVREISSVDFSRLVEDADWKKEAVPGYRLLSPVAGGGFGSIVTAEPVFGGPKVAVKRLDGARATDEAARRRFERESELLRRLESEHIVRGLDFGTSAAGAYIVMEYVEGRSLGQALAASGPFPVRAALRVTRQLAAALDDLHAAGHAHRDVRPDNALIDRDGRVKLCDLGFAEPFPEGDAEGAAAAVEADLYALGLMLYALLTGHEPFEGVSSEEMASVQIDRGNPVPNLMVVPAGPPVVQLLKRMMHPDAKRRFASATAVIGAIDGIKEP